MKTGSAKITTGAPDPCSSAPEIWTSPDPLTPYGHPLTLKYELIPAGGTDPDPHVPASAAELQCKPFATQTAFGSHLHRPTPDFCLSALEKERLSYTPSTPACLRGPVKIESMGESQRARPKDTVIIQQNFPKTYPTHQPERHAQAPTARTQRATHT